MTSFRLQTHNAPGHATATRRILGISPAELRTMVAILSHESVFAHSPTRAALVAFLGLHPVAYRLIVLGWIQSRTIGPIAGARLAVWSSTDTARRALGLDAREEQLSA